MSDKVELKPCPFCGCENIVVRKYTAVAGVHYYAQCDSANGGCGANIDSRTTKNNAVEDWNRRKEVRRGEWICVTGTFDTVAGVRMTAVTGYKCSVCGHSEIEKYPFCNCGAKMTD